MNPFPLLATPRLNLREITVADAPGLLTIHGDVEAMRWFGSDPIADLAGAKKLIDTFAGWRIMPNPGIRWGIERKLDGELLGTCGLFKCNTGWSSCSIGYELAQSSWGLGYMSEALQAVLVWGFDNMALVRIEAQVHPRNTPSIQLLERLGFVREGLLREAGFWLGQRHDLLHFGLLQQEFHAPIRGEFT